MSCQGNPTSKKADLFFLIASIFLARKEQRKEQERPPVSEVTKKFAASGPTIHNESAVKDDQSHPKQVDYREDNN
ncbi:MAG: hypothetical protein A3J62_02790 [Candidatus Buchananbacteria bacterium RIFCSPHIGHO2_02_FULL_38_8]|uniref:Uncharacterized protein n=2 Tax=Candidatus Buchananiibacteriota TaxID=1817903 RepID=A0A1G1Y1Z6_9BACT|nr:MAG: hypothetical protein A2731_01910 [Candidatus Buchananbacteria bacterium RIFCSPHIGHO2_01_FULL_39_8]OGY47517.1 MAG: hypothetical protein A3J62_02790 [Candidatus Buchananbacteria bacterium RIFCSPHIGHO2_02_FULL_38_8]